MGKKNENCNSKNILACHQWPRKAFSQKIIVHDFLNRFQIEKLPHFSHRWRHRQLLSSVCRRWCFFFLSFHCEYVPNDFRALLKLNEYEIETTQRSAAQCNRYSCFVMAIRALNGTQQNIKKKTRHQLKNIIERFVEKSQLNSIFHLDLLIRQWEIRSFVTVFFFASLSCSVLGLSFFLCVLQTSAERNVCLKQICTWAIIILK